MSKFLENNLKQSYLTNIAYLQVTGRSCGWRNWRKTLVSCNSWQLWTVMQQRILY